MKEALISLLIKWCNKLNYVYFVFLTKDWDEVANV